MSLRRPGPSSLLVLLTQAVVAVGLLAPFVAHGDEKSQPTTAGPLTDRERAIHVLSRLAFGPTPGALAEVEAIGVKAWIERQLDPEKIADEACEKRLVDMQSLKLGNRALMDVYNPQPKDDSEAEQKRVEELRQKPRRELKAAVLLRAIYSERQLQEVLVDFWRNHLNVSLNKDECTYIAPDYEREVIRKHVFGRFEDMLLASAKHPAMLIYLDQRYSQKPLSATDEKYLKKSGENLSPAQRQFARTRGLNENYARELMELHTLGVDNGYTQRDVVEVARVLTGWTINYDPKGDFGFWFRPDVHDSEAKYVMGTSIPRDQNPSADEGVAVIRALARHKNTARFIAWKLCRYLVRDDPPEALVTRAAKVFRDTTGDLKAVVKAIVLDEEFYARANYKAKFKTPFEFVVSALRATGAELKNPQPIHEYLALMGQPLYECDDPTGYYDTREAWLDPGVLALRWQFALDLCESRLGGAKVPPAFFTGRGKLEAEKAKLEKWLGPSLVGVELETQLAAVLVQAIADARFMYGEDATKRRTVGLALGSPQFQKQ